MKKGHGTFSLPRIAGRAGCALLAACLLLPLGGCMRSVKLKDRAIVQAVGVDYLEGKYQLTFQYFVPEGSGGKTAFDASKLNNNIITAQGTTMTEAVDAAGRKQGKQIFFGSNKIIILGRSLAEEEGIRPAVDYFNANHQLDPSVYLMIADGEASEVVSAQISRGIVPAAAIEQIADNQRARRHLEGGRMIDAASNFQNNLPALLMPVIRLQETDGEVNVAMEGGALLKNYKLVDDLSQQEIQGTLWLKGKMARDLMVVELPGSSRCSLEILSSNIKKRPRLAPDGHVIFEVALQVESNLREVLSHGNGEVDRGVLGTAARTQEKAIRQQINLALQKAVRENKADIFEIYAYLRQYLPVFYNQSKDNYEQVLEQMEFDVKILCTISRMGLEATEN